jgi:hypothetical protein
VALALGPALYPDGARVDANRVAARDGVTGFRSPRCVCLSPRHTRGTRVMVERDRLLAIRTSAEEAAMLKVLAEAERISQSDYVRLFNRRAYAEKFGAKKPKRA